MSEPTSAPDPNATPAVPPAPTYSYGEAAPAAPPPPAAPAAPPAYGAPGYAAPVYGAPAPTGQRKTWDLVLTIVLLVLGLIGMSLGVFYGFLFLSPQLLNEVLVQQGNAAPTIDTRGPGMVIVISHLALYLVALGAGILLLVKKKIAFWVPLAAGVIATFVFWFVAIQVFLSIPGFAGY